MCPTCKCCSSIHLTTLPNMIVHYAFLGCMFKKLADSHAAHAIDSHRSTGTIISTHYVRVQLLQLHKDTRCHTMEKGTTEKSPSRGTWSMPFGPPASQTGGGVSDFNINSLPGFSARQVPSAFHCCKDCSTSKSLARRNRSNSCSSTITASDLSRCCRSFMRICRKSAYAACCSAVKLPASPHFKAGVFGSNVHRHGSSSGLHRAQILYVRMHPICNVNSQAHCSTSAFTQPHRSSCISNGVWPFPSSSSFIFTSLFPNDRTCGETPKIAFAVPMTAPL